jgi:hypothetical protein
LKERRRTIRIKEADKATIVLYSEFGKKQIKKIYQVLTKDLSVKGIKIPIDTFIPVGASLKIMILLENPTRFIHTNGNIRWIKCLHDQELYETGIEFVGMTQENVKILEKHIRGTEE